MRTKAIFLLIPLAFMMAVVHAEELAESCAVCHKGALSLDQWTTDDLAARLKEMGAGPAQHPVPLPVLSEEELQALSRLLTAR